jgi:hypothetical protein
MITVFTDHVFSTIGAKAFPARNPLLMRDLGIAVQTDTKAGAIFMLQEFRLGGFI